VGSFACIATAAVMSVFSLLCVHRTVTCHCCGAACVQQYTFKACPTSHHEKKGVLQMGCEQMGCERMCGAGIMISIGCCESGCEAHVCDAVIGYAQLIWRHMAHACVQPT